MWLNFCYSVTICYPHSIAVMEESILYSALPREAVSKTKGPAITISRVEGINMELILESSPPPASGKANLFVLQTILVNLEFMSLILRDSSSGMPRSFSSTITTFSSSLSSGGA